VITEVGGTVGDMESLPFLEAIRQVRHEIGRDHVFYLHVSLVPYLAPSGELKTKPTQHSVAALRNIGIQPDALVCRSDREIPEKLKHKLSLYCDVDREAVVAARTRRASTTSQGAAPRGPRRVRGAPARPVVPRRRLATWDDLLTGCTTRADDHVALVGKYVDLPDAYLSVSEAIRAAGLRQPRPGCQHRWVPSDDATPAGRGRRAEGASTAS
jgi:CTP synthase